MPATIPVTTPLVALIATLVLPVLQLPPDDGSLSVVVAPTHTCSVPFIPGGYAPTVTTADAMQPAALVNVIPEVPVATPVIIPEEVIVATAVVALLQVPADVSLTDVVKPGHTTSVPEIAPGKPFTVTISLRVQPSEEVNVMIAVPTEKPLTTPNVKLTGATVILLLLQVPAEESVRLVVEPTHTVAIPLMDGGNGFTTTVAVVKHPLGIV